MIGGRAKGGGNVAPTHFIIFHSEKREREREKINKQKTGKKKGENLFIQFSFVFIS